VEAGNSEAASRVRELLERLVRDVGVHATVRVHEDDETITGEFVGDDLGLVIGHHGQTIDAIQHLAYRIAYRGAQTRKRVIVDAAGYR
jgi:spoIIIJ-associated protein